MRIALFSDIHANLPALEAFFNDVEARDTDAIYCLGDLVGYNIWPSEVIDHIKRRGIPERYQHTSAWTFNATISRCLCCWYMAVHAGSTSTCLKTGTKKVCYGSWSRPVQT